MHCPNSGYLSGWKSARVFLLAKTQLCPPSSVRIQPTAEIPIHILAAFEGSGMIVCRHKPPAPGSQRSRVGWLARLVLSSHVSPLSVLYQRLAGSTPA